MDPRRFHIEKGKFVSGGFHNAFKKYTTNPREYRVVKDSKWQSGKSWNVDLQSHTRKQVQIHMTPKVIAEKLATKAKNSKVFTRHFSHNASCFATLDSKPINVEKFVDGEFTKYVNND